jgi:hypothetical protein
MINYSEADKKERKDARLAIYADLFFYIFPFILAIVVSALVNGWATFSMSDFPLAATMIFWQTLLRFNGGIGNYKGKYNVNAWLIYQSLIIIGLILSVALYVVARGNKAMGFIWVSSELVLFLVSIGVYVVFGGLGQWLSGRSKKKKGILSHHL